MDDNNLKEIWRSEVDEDVEKLSREELRDMVLMRTRSTVNKLYSKWATILAGVMFLFSVMGLLLDIFSGDFSFTFDVAFFQNMGLLLLFGFIFVYGIVGRRRYLKRDYSLSIVQWLEQRVGWLEKQERRNKLYGIPLLLVGSGILTLLFHSWEGETYVSAITYWLIVFALAVPIHFLLMREFGKKFRKLKELQEQLNTVWDSEEDVVAEELNQEELREMVESRIRTVIEPLFPVWELILFGVFFMLGIVGFALYGAGNHFWEDLRYLIFFGILFVYVIVGRIRYVRMEYDKPIQQWVDERVERVESARKRARRFGLPIVSVVMVILLGFFYYSGDSYASLGSSIVVLLIVLTFAYIGSQRTYKTIIETLKEIQEQLAEGAYSADSKKVE